MPTVCSEKSVMAQSPRPAKVIGGAGRLVPQKNFERFLRIARTLQALDPSYQFMIAGTGPLDQLLRQRAEELGVKIEWLGVQSTLDRFFNSIDLFLLTSDFEGLPMTVLEALQCGIPAAAMAVDGLREEFTNEILLLDPNSSDFEIGRRIHALVQDQTEVWAQVERGRELVAGRFSARAQIRENGRSISGAVSEEEVIRGQSSVSVASCQRRAQGIFSSAQAIAMLALGAFVRELLCSSSVGSQKVLTQFQDTVLRQNSAEMGERINQRIATDNRTWTDDRVATDLGAIPNDSPEFAKSGRNGVVSVLTLISLWSNRTLERITPAPRWA